MSPVGIATHGRASGSRASLEEVVILEWVLCCFHRAKYQQQDTPSTFSFMSGLKRRPHALASRPIGSHLSNQCSHMHKIAGSWFSLVLALGLRDVTV
eukprot:1270247-Amphidinium_carterae.1